MRDNEGIKRTDTQAVKKHKCDVCGGVIDKGEIYTTIIKRIGPKEKFKYPKTFKICLYHDIDTVIQSLNNI